MIKDMTVKTTVKIWRVLK